MVLNQLFGPYISIGFVGSYGDSRTKSFMTPITCHCWPLSFTSCPMGFLNFITFNDDSLRIIASESVGYCCMLMSRPAINFKPAVLPRSPSSLYLLKSVLSAGSFPSHSCPQPSLQLSVSGALVLVTEEAVPVASNSFFIRE